MSKLSESWTLVKFGDVAYRVAETVVPTPEQSRIYIGLEHMRSDSCLISEWGSDVDLDVPKTPVRKGDVLFARRNTHLRRCSVAPMDSIFSPDGYALRTRDPHVLLQEFLLHVVASADFMDFAVEHSAGTHSKRVKWSSLVEYEFALPPIDKQKRIVELLSSADDQIEAMSRLKLATEEFRQAILLDAIWDNSVKEWCVPLQEVSELLLEPPRNGISPAAAPEGEGSLTVSLSVVQDGRFLVKPEYVKWCRPAGDSSRFVVHEFDAFVVRGNGNRALVGRLGLCDAEPPNDVLYPDLLIRLRFNPQIIEPSVATAIWNLKRVHDGLLARAKSSNGIFKVNGKDISGHRLPVPSMKVQERLISELAHIDAVRTAAEQVVANSLGLRSSLLAQALEVHPHVQ